MSGLFLLDLTRHAKQAVVNKIKFYNNISLILENHFWASFYALLLHFSLYLLYNN